MDGIRAHLNALDQDMVNYNDNRIFLNEEEDITTKRNFERLQEIEEKLKQMKSTDIEKEYDIDAAADVLAAIYPDHHPRDVLCEQGIPFDDVFYDPYSSSVTSDDDDKSKFKTSPDEEVCIMFCKIFYIYVKKYKIINTYIYKIFLILRSFS